MGVLYIKFLSRPFGNPFEGKGKIRKGKEKKRKKRRKEREQARKPSIMRTGQISQ